MPRPDIQIFVCLNARTGDSAKPSCGRRDASSLYYRLKDLVRERDLRDQVLITKTGCQHHCSRGPTVSVWPQNHWFGHVAADDAETVLEAALTGEMPERLRMPDGPWE